MSSSSVSATHSHGTPAGSAVPQLFVPSGISAFAAASSNGVNVTTANVNSTAASNSTATSDGDSVSSLQKHLVVQIRRANDLIDRIRGTEISENTARALKTFLTSVDNVVRPVDQKRDVDDGDGELCQRQADAGGLESLVEAVKSFLDGLLKGLDGGAGGSANGTAALAITKRDIVQPVKLATMEQALRNNQRSPELSAALHKAKTSLHQLEGKTLSQTEEQALRTYINQVNQGLSGQQQQLQSRDQITDLIQSLLQAVNNLLSSLLGGGLSSRSEITDLLQEALQDIVQTINSILTHTTTTTSGLVGGLIDALQKRDASLTDEIEQAFAQLRDQLFSTDSTANSTTSQGQTFTNQVDSGKDTTRLLAQAKIVTDKLLKATDNQQDQDDGATQQQYKRDQNGSSAVSIPKSMVALAALIFAGVCAV
ncbi:hypothetical protein TRICI_001453 [Trichomonascus ciferrii]|uniref:Uncharacterized protein n=1 Tax=Trichomonascus ciferrii TaxID=44093 RepID=A0A642V9N2_9ASCO|nr:hypothetical protein TRICI_001453 [Trichomonascus ciferrii]